METIDDIHNEPGNSDAGGTEGRPQPINQAFHTPGAGMRLGSVVVFIGGVFTTLVGIWTLVVPISVVGLLIVLVAAFMFVRASAEGRI
jgi:hypothetical protein